MVLPVCQPSHQGYHRASSGQALGAAWYPARERQITTKEQMLDEMCSLMGGRAAEELFTGHISSGAMNDLERATKSAYGMVAYLGMSKTLPNICFYNRNEYSFQRPYSESTAPRDRPGSSEDCQRTVYPCQEHPDGAQGRPQCLSRASDQERGDYGRRRRTYLWQASLVEPFAGNHGRRTAYR